MTLSELTRLSDFTLSGQLTYIAAKAVSDPTEYGFTAPQAASLESAAETFSSSLNDWNAAKGSYDEASEAKANQRQAAVEVFTQLLNLMYATPTVTPEAISSLSLTPRNGARSPIVPVTPTDFIATPFADGTVELKWNRNGNKYGVVFEVETAGADLSDWQIGLSTTRSKVRVSGFTPGVPAWFRVRATKNGVDSEFSFNSGIYIPAPGGSGSMEVAA